MSHADRASSPIEVRVLLALQGDLDAARLGVVLSIDEFESLHPALGLLEDVSDLREASVIRVTIGRELVGAVVLGMSADSGDETISGILAHVADRLQDEIVDSLRIAWPRCPDHAHPLKAEERERVAIWVCPESGRRVADIGHLKQ